MTAIAIKMQVRKFGQKLFQISYYGKCVIVNIFRMTKQMKKLLSCLQE